MELDNQSQKVTEQGFEASFQTHFSAWLNIVEKSLGSHLQLILFNVTGASLRRRIVQRISQITHLRFNLDLIEKFKQNDLNSSYFFENEFEGIKVKKGLLEIDLLTWCREYMLFAIFWGVYLVEWFKLIRYLVLRPKNIQFTLVADLASSHLSQGLDTPFCEFIDSCEIDIFSSRNIIVVQRSDALKSQSQRVHYHRWPISRAIQLRGVKVGEWLSIGWLHVLFFISSHFNFFLRGPSIFLARDFGQASFYQWAQKHKLILAHVITDANAEQQILPLGEMRYKAPIHMFWHSQNVQGFVYNSQPHQWNFYYYFRMKVDHHWMWTAEFEQWLRSLGETCECHHLGPVLWKPIKRPKLIRDNVIRILAFDVTPTSAEYKNANGFLFKYYNMNSCPRFVEDICRIAKELSTPNRPIEVWLKHKRRPGKVHDHEYFKKIGELESRYQCLKVIGHDVDHYEIACQSTIAIGMPYTTAVGVPTFIGVPSCHYDPTKEMLEVKPNVMPKAQFVSGYDNLKIWIENHIKL